MAVLINHLISWIIEPYTVSFAGLVVGLILATRKFRKTGFGIAFAALGWLYFCSTPIISRVVGCSLEREFPPTSVEKVPQADAIVLLSGGMGGSTNVWNYGEMWSAADRVWHAARLWKAGKAPILLTTGIEIDNSTVNLLTDLGVDPGAIVTERKSLNTEENAKFTEQTLKERFPTVAKHKVILVTSAWHMRRSVLMFNKYTPGIEVVPSGADYENLQGESFGDWIDLIRPSAGSLDVSARVLKEVVGYWGYRLR